MKNDSNDSATDAKPTREQVAIRAELLWKAQGSPSGKDEQIWLEAERQLFDEAREIIASTPETKPQRAEPKTEPRSADAEQMTPKRSGASSGKRRSSGK